MYELIDNYIEGKLSEADHAAFETRLAQDQALAEELAFYLSTKAALRDNALQQRHAQWTQQRPTQPLRWQWTSGLAAAMVILVGAWYFLQPASPTLQMQADAYIEQTMKTLPNHLDASTDSLQMAIEFYNTQKYNEALPIFTGLARTNPRARTYEGFTQLQLKNYDAAIQIFEQIATNTELLDNKGKFYAAIAYFKKGDPAAAQRLLEEVVAQNLAGKTEAEQWLKNAQP
jgi:tetratricopeptide (TPR) repeat protein